VERWAEDVVEFRRVQLEVAADVCAEQANGAEVVAVVGNEAAQVKRPINPESVRLEVRNPAVVEVKPRHPCVVGDDRVVDPAVPELDTGGEHERVVLEGRIRLLRVARADDSSVPDAYAVGMEGGAIPAGEKSSYNLTAVRMAWICRAVEIS
jgi:hypothetical protein